MISSVKGGLRQLIKQNKHSGLEDFVFAESRGSIVQVGENTVLALEDVPVLVESSPVVRIVVGPVRAGQVAVLRDTELAIADLFIRQPGNDHLRVRVGIARDDVVVHGRAVIQGLILADG